MSVFVCAALLVIPAIDIWTGDWAGLGWFVALYFVPILVCWPIVRRDWWFWR